jgi:hypothetical protein
MMTKLLFAALLLLLHLANAMDLVHLLDPVPKTFGKLQVITNTIQNTPTTPNTAAKLNRNMIQIPPLSMKLATQQRFYGKIQNPSDRHNSKWIDIPAEYGFAPIFWSEKANRKIIKAYRESKGVRYIVKCDKTNEAYHKENKFYDVSYPIIHTQTIDTCCKVYRK